MTTRSRLLAELLRPAPVLAPETRIAEAVGLLLESGLPALPVARETGEACGIFGEREFIAALFPGYVGELGGAAFVSGTLDAVLEKRTECGAEPVERHMTPDHVTVAEDASDLQLAEIFLHHRVLIVPVLAGDRVAGVITRGDFFRALVGRLPGVPG